MFTTMSKENTRGRESGKRKKIRREIIAEMTCHWGKI
jgi:hypothetical protein